MPMGKLACGVMCFAAMAAVFVAQAAKESLSFHGTTDKDPIAYACGEEMVFTVTLVDRNAKNAPVAGRRFAWTLDGDTITVVDGSGLHAGGLYFSRGDGADRSCRCTRSQPFRNEKSGPESCEF